MASFTVPSLRCMLLLVTLIFASLSHSLPIPETYINGSGTQSLVNRSPSPRMAPENMDLVSWIFTKAGLEGLAKLNQSWGKYAEDFNDPAVIDDSQSPQNTTTSHDNVVDQQTKDVVTTEKSDIKDPKDDPAGFVDSLFSRLKEKFHEALNSSDEIPLNQG